MNIAFFTRKLDGGCPFYRIYQIRDAIARNYDIKDVEAFVFDEKINLDLHRRAIDEADVLVFQANYSPDISRYSQHNNVVMEMDDLIWEVPYLQHQYAEWGTEEVFIMKDDKPKYLWKNGKNGFDMNRNTKMVKQLEHNLRAVQQITVTTEALRKEYLTLNDNIKVLPNCIDFNLWKKPQMKKREVRILWQGADAHYWDIYMIRNLFKRINDKYPEVKWVFNGSMWKKFMDGVNYEHQGWIDISGHPFRTMCMNADIGIAPLRDTRFNRSKSPLKWMEYSAMGVPTIASPIVYEEEIENGVTGMIAKDEDEWYEMLSFLIENETERIEMGNKAYDDVYERFNLDKNIHQWVEAYESLMVTA